MKPHELYNEFKNRQDIVDLLLTKFSKEELGMSKWPERWEDLNKLEGWYINSDAEIFPSKPHIGKLCHKNLFVSEKQAKSALAYAQLSQIVAKMNDGWIPDWNNDEQNKYTIHYAHDKQCLRTNVWCESMQAQLYFKTEEMANFSIKYHESLWLQYFMI